MGKNIPGATAHEQLIEIVEAKGRIEADTEKLKDLVKREVASYNEWLRKTGQPEKRISYAEAVKKVEASPTKATLKSILNSTSRSTKQGAYKTKHIKAVTPKEVKPKYESPAAKKKREYKEKMGTGFKEYVKGTKEITKYRKRYTKDPNTGVVSSYYEKGTVKGKGIQDISDYNIRKLGRIFEELRAMGVVGDIISSDEVVEAALSAEEKLGGNVSLTKILKWMVDNNRDYNTAKALNNIFNAEIYALDKYAEHDPEEEAEEIPGDAAEDAVFGGR